MKDPKLTQANEGHKGRHLANPKKIGNNTKGY